MQARTIFLFTFHGYTGPPGSGINWHRDAPPFNIIVGISLSSDCIFRLRPYQPQGKGHKTILSLSVQRRSLYTLKGSVRTDWEHSTMAVKTTRYSITLRALK